MACFRVTSEFWVSAFRKKLERQAIPIFVIKKGDRGSGAIIIRVSDMCGSSKLFVQAPSTDGERRWMELMIGEDFEIDAMLLREQKLDKDLWILEIEEIYDWNFCKEFLFLTTEK